MKRYLYFVLLCFPMVSFGAPSVRMLGNQQVLMPAGASNAKVNSVKSSANAAVDARVGTLRATNKATTLTTSSGNTNSSSRFPVIAPAHSYSSVDTPQSISGAVPAYANVDVAAIIDAVTQDIDDRYYDKNEVYDNDSFIEAVREITPGMDDPRLDAIRVRNSSPKSYWESKGKSLPSDYIYIWIEED